MSGAQAHESGGTGDRVWPVGATEAGAESWRAACVAQRTEVPDHHDFYDLASASVNTVVSLGALVGVLRGQVAGYGSDRELRDDEGGDPADRVAQAVVQLELASGFLSRAEQALNLYWSAIAHIGTEVPS